jgi:hypothetical protein
MADGTAWTEATYELLSILRPGCTTFTDFQTGFIGKLLLPIYALVLFVFVFFISRVFGLCDSRLAQDPDVALNCYMAVFNTFFIGIAQQTFTLFQCYKHPNDEKSLRSQADIICGEDDWNSVMVIALACAIVFCGGFLTLNFWIAMVAPYRFHSKTFRKRFKFLFIKFRPSTWYWGIILLVKGVWLNLPTVVFDYGAGQILWLQSFIVCYLIGVFSFMPWRSFTTAVLDIIMHAILLFGFAFVTHFVDMGDSNDDSLAMVYVIITMAPIAQGALIVAWLLYRRFFNDLRGNDIFWEKAAVEACTVFSMCNDPVGMARRLPQLPFSDIMTLNNAKQVLELEVLDKAKRGARASSTIAQSTVLKMTSRTRLKHTQSYNDTDNASSSDTYLKDGADSNGNGNGSMKDKSNGNGHGDVQSQLRAMRHLVKPDAEWLCEALETALNDRPWQDLPAAKRHTNQNNQAIDDLYFPEEHTGHLLQRDPRFSPRAIPPGKLTTPRTPRRAASPRKPMTWMDVPTKGHQAMV